MIEPPHVGAARRITLGLVLQRRAQGFGRLIPLRLVVELDYMAVGIAKAIGRPVAKFAIDPAYFEAGFLNRLRSPLKRLRAARTEGGVAEGSLFRRLSTPANIVHSRPTHAEKPNRPYARSPSCPSRR
jgi:hypothetical protein